jgi:hypothetical protein
MTRLKPLALGVPFAFAAVLLFSLLCGMPHSDHTIENDPSLAAHARAACSRCHPFPPPEILPRASWKPQIEYMAWLREYRLGDRTGSLASFSARALTAWFESRAPEELPVALSLTRDEPSPLRFDRKFVNLGRDAGPGVATVEELEAEQLPGNRPLLAVPNMMNGSVHLFSMTSGPRLVGHANHPVRVAAGDLDRDGRDDLVISDLGDPMPTDELVGRVVVARNAGGGSFEIEVVLEDIGRVADARPTDLDADGDLDIVVAAFGWFRAGGIYVLYNQTAIGGALDFRAEQITDRPGAVSIIPVEDLQPGSGRGFVVAFSQHYEEVTAFYPTETGFAEHVLYRAPHPNWGVDSLEAVDLDGDSDLDFLLAHGDTLDDGVAFKFYHGVEWLENRGGLGFRPHRIGTLYGSHRAEAADLDGDGDLDVVASGFLPQVPVPVPRSRMRVDSVIWFERTDEEWIPRSIEVNHPRHTGMTLADLNHDGRIDIIAAINRAWDAQKIEVGPSLEIWINRGPAQRVEE